MDPLYCIDCGATIRVKPKKPGICPYCGVHLATGRDTFQALESPGEPPPIRDHRRRNTRAWGALQLAAGAILIAIFASGDRMRIVPVFGGGMLAAHGLFRLLFASGPNRDDEDYEDLRKD